MENTMKLPIFIGIGSEYTEQLWFVANTVWTLQQIIDDNIKKA